MPCGDLDILASSTYRFWLSAVLCSPPTAMRLLSDVVELQPGDVVVQNGANSVVGQVGWAPSRDLL